MMCSLMVRARRGHDHEEIEESEVEARQDKTVGSQSLPVCATFYIMLCFVVDSAYRRAEKTFNEEKQVVVEPASVST